jgi:hypothetical protein
MNLFLQSCWHYLAPHICCSYCSGVIDVCSLPGMVKLRKLLTTVVGTSFRFSLVDYNLIDADLLPAMPGCISQPICDPERLKVHCAEEIIASIADVFAPVAVTCLAKAGLQIQSLEFNQATMHDAQCWNDILGWEKLDLSNLRHLSFEPYLPNYLHDDDHLAMGILLRQDLDFLFSQSSQSLETFTTRRALGLSWYGRPPALPNLTNLVLGLCNIPSDFLCEWLDSMPKLNTIILHAITLCPERGEDEPAENWKKVFDVMRDHETLKHGLLDEICLNRNEGYTFSVCFDKDQRLEVDLEEDFLSCLDFHKEGVKLATMLYLCGKTGWRGILSDFFC